MQILAGLSVALLMLAALAVALKTIALWRRTRGAPELLLSMMLISATVLGYPLAIASTRIPATELWPVHVGAQVLISLGFACLLLFTLRVFRPNSLWATSLAGLALVLLLVSTLAFISEATGEHPRGRLETAGPNLLMVVSIGIAYFWTTLEALSYWRRLRLRLRLGLTDAVVTNRVLLWGLMSLAAGVALVVNVCAGMAGSLMNPLMLSVSSGLGLAHACCLFLAFHPPGWYKHWLLRTHAAAAS